MKQYTNPFRNKHLRECFDNAIKAYQEKSKLFFMHGKPHKGNAWASHFWRGYDSVKMNWDRQSKSLGVYAYFIAGRRCKEKEQN